ncbi:MAG: glycosyl hydrolase, partial [Planctomycetes bacterium]|nr:glycosyl hydrolase [Planctomycetota bacterium]
MRRPLTLAVLLTVHLACLPALLAQGEARGSRLSLPPDPVFAAAMVDGLAWRNLGPVNPAGRVTDVAVHRDRRSTWFVGTAGGGVFRTENAGTTFENVFDRQGSVSIGDIAIAPSDPDIVWIGTGEENARNSVQWGDGVY